MIRVILLPLLCALPALSLLNAAALGSDFADSRGPDAGRESPRVAAWQQAELKSPGTAVHRVDLPAAKPLKPPGDAPAATPSGFDKIGYVEPFDERLLPAWPFEPRDQRGAVARVEFNSDGACGLRLHFENFDPGEEIELRLYDAAGDTVLGPFRAPRVDEAGGWWSPTIFGDTMGVELYAPKGMTSAPKAPDVTKVAFLAELCNTTPAVALGCHNDVVCHSSWDDDEARGVALIYFVSGAFCGRCTGALLTRQPDDGSPLFMTANHCISTAAEANSLEVYWFYETASCDGAAPATPANQPRNLGSLRLKRYTDADWTLLGLYEPPVPGVRYLGWDTGYWGLNADASGVHHPRGTFKRISFGETGGTSTGTFCDSTGTDCFDARVRKVTYTSGTTEGGSSGSPIFDASRRVRGTLTGGENLCPEVDKYYGRLYLAYDHLRYYMGDSYIASPVHVDAVAASDPGNNGDTERGTSAQPFNTVHEATYAVRSSDELWIQPGNYDERLTIWRPMTLVRRGSTGVVRIGD